MPGFGARLGAAIELVEYQNSNLAYRMAMEGIHDDCTAQIIDFPGRRNASPPPTYSYESTIP